MFGFSPKFPHTQQKQHPRTVIEQQVLDTGRFDPEWAHAYIQRPKLPISTVGNYAYATLGLCEFSPVGTGVVPRWHGMFRPAGLKSIASNGRPMLYFQGAFIQGLGGLVPGQMFGTPLINPNVPPTGS